jgi:hypothetical protein
MRPIPTLYIPVPSPFPVLETFIADSARRYNLDLFLCKGQSERVESVVTPSPVPSPAPGPAPGNGNSNATRVDYLSIQTQTQKPRAVGKAKGAEGMRQALEIYKSRFPHRSAILVGTRRSDPHGGVHVISYMTQIVILIMQSYAITPKYDGPRLASLRAYKPHHQLVVRRRLGLSPETQSSLLCTV